MKGPSPSTVKFNIKEVVFIPEEKRRTLINAVPLFCGIVTGFGVSRYKNLITPINFLIRLGSVSKERRVRVETERDPGAQGVKKTRVRVRHKDETK